MSTHLTDTPVLGLLPQSISGDETIHAAAEALEPVFGALTRSVPNLLVYARLFAMAGKAPFPHAAPLERLIAAAGGLKPLTTAELELLAWHLHVDFRETATDDVTLAKMIASSIAWHRIKGTPASITRALALFGYTATIEENGPGPQWAWYQLGLPEIADIQTVRKVWSICQEMQPARCKLWRMYSGYDMRPIIVSKGPPLSNGWLSYYSGVPIDIPGGGQTGGGDDGDVVVSFGASHKMQFDPAYPDDDCAGLAVSETMVIVCPYIDCFTLSYSRLGDVYPQNHGFTIGQLHSLIWAEPQTEGLGWSGSWQGPWYEFAPWDRILPEWAMTPVRRTARVQLVLSVPESDSDIGKDPSAKFPIGTLSDINARLGRTYITQFTSPKLGELRLSESDPQRTEEEITVVNSARMAFQVSPVGASPVPFGVSVLAQVSSETAPLHSRQWNGRSWKTSEAWWPYLAQTKISEE